MGRRIFGGLTLKELALGAWREAYEDRAFGRAAELAYFFLLALFPMLIFLLSVFSFLPGLQDALLDWLAKVMPREARRLVASWVENVVGARSGGLLSLGLLGSLWAASNGIGAAIDALNTAYNVEEGRPFWKSRLMAIGLTFERLFGTQPGAATARESWSTRVFKGLLSFALAALLATMLAFRPRKDISIFRRNPFIAQTQILLAVVGAAMMIVVADNAARAFGIFAAASLIRFRTNIRDPKEITILLVSLSIGLATGVGRWELAAALALFVMLILWPLERFELSQVFRAMELEVKTYDLGKTDAALKKIFRKRHISEELRKFDPEDDKDSPGTILYYLTLRPDLSTDRLSEEIFASDSQNIDSIKWQQKKSSSYIYR
jgi:uncharacterized BrkB/YihY/UPF0761 family membrane protein